MKICTQCQKQFEVTSADREFYAKVKVPEPTLCPDCRYQRRIAYRNERNLYQNKCGLCKKAIISIFSVDKPYTVYCGDCWFSDKWNPLSYGREFDFSRPFFEQFKELQQAVPQLYAFVSNNVNSVYTNGSQDNKDCYLLFVSDHNENTHYSYSVFDCRDVVDSIDSTKVELSYELSGCSNCYHCFYSIDCHNCNDVYFSVDCTGCSNCFGCSNLRNKSFYFFNEQLSPDEYRKRVAEYRLGSYGTIQKLLAKRKGSLGSALYRYYHGINNHDSTGDYLKLTKNAKRCFESNGIEDSAFLTHGYQSKDCYDGYVIVDRSELCYEGVSVIGAYNSQFLFFNAGATDCRYCASIRYSKNCFGCVGVRQAEFCIFNKQYSEKEYRELVPRIIEHMKKTGEYGEYFPIANSPFAYNETAAQEYYPLTKEAATARGLQWKDDIGGTPQQPTLQITAIPDDIKDVKDTIVNEIFGCESCGKNYRIVAQELGFYMRENVPLPRKCFNCRHLDRLTIRNPRKLWKRKCNCGGAVSGNGIRKNTAAHAHGASPCPNEFETTYSPDRPETVYCEQCYQSEMA